MNNKFMDYLITTEYDKEKNYTIIMNRINEKRKTYYIPKKILIQNFIGL